MKRVMPLFVAWVLVLGLCACGTESKNLSEPELGYQDYYDLGVRYLSEGNYEEAIIAFTAAIEIEPNRAEAYVGRGKAYYLSGNTAENLSAAAADFQSAIGLDATLAEAYLGLADVYIQQGDLEKAAEVLKQGLDGAGNNQEISDKLTEVTEQLEEERQEERLNELAETSTMEFLEQAAGDLENGDYESALETLRTPLEEAGDGAEKLASLNKAVELIEEANAAGQKVILVNKDTTQEEWNALLDQSNALIILDDETYPWLLDLNSQTNVTVQGLGNAQIIIDSPDDMIVDLDGCQNITLRGLVLGHNPALTEGMCEAGVASIYRGSTNIVFEDCDIFGCGLEGAFIGQDSTVTMRNSVIRDCSRCILEFNVSGRGEFENCSFYGNGSAAWLPALYVSYGVGTATFTNCDFHDNMNPNLMEQGSGNFTFNNCTFSGNAWD